jgi:hypothetical protein
MPSKQASPLLPPKRFDIKYTKPAASSTLSTTLLSPSRWTALNLISGGHEDLIRNQIQPLDLSAFGMTKRLISRVNRMEAVNVQSLHIGQVVGSFMSAGSPPNIVGTFRIAGIRLALQDGTLVCEDARRGFTRMDTIIKEEDGERLERELYIKHCAEALTGEEMIRPE